MAAVELRTRINRDVRLSSYGECIRRDVRRGMAANVKSFLHVAEKPILLSSQAEDYWVKASEFRLRPIIVHWSNSKYSGRVLIISSEWCTRTTKLWTRDKQNTNSDSDAPLYEQLDLSNRIGSGILVLHNHFISTLEVGVQKLHSFEIVIKLDLSDVSWTYRRKSTTTIL